MGYGERPTLTLYPVRVPKFQQSPQWNNLALQGIAPVEGGRARAWCGTTERVSYARSPGKISISVRTFQGSNALAKRCALGNPRQGSWEWGLHHSAPAEERDFPEDSSRIGKGESEATGVDVEVPDPPGGEGQVWKKPWTLSWSILGIQA